ncbi:ATP-binding cassette sub-family A member 2 [Galendromus occidentalis]|uniref:ATP-binding cassette sub-family A member 2 n=1 Tax=Galendromus occidentalis TaxID=34638 RepID=A0AAJ7L7G2_9ACAR|nr:ATP-binding cassette sub-family A member 2 [Galendromus occidentalis]
MGALVSILLWFVGIILSSVWMDSQTSNNYTSIGASYKLLSLFLPPCGCYWTFKLIGFWEQADVGVQFSNLGQIASPGDNITLLQLVLAQVAIWFLYGFLIFYLDAIVPWQYGIPKHPLFLFRRSYWSLNREPSKKARPSSSENLEMFEAVSESLCETVVELVNVTKYFNGKKKAVDDLSAKFYKNQISVILGHNGAGKTTTMNILTGLFPPSCGNMYINGYSVQENTKKARESVGLCPQHNVLFDDLTVVEHLRYFGIMKNAERVEEEINELLDKFDLTKKRFTLSKDLSGGMKRKLSMANAMIGGSEILILDEPTAGMDPQARRAVWTILQEARKTRSILLTTHYMEEADVLGDRIAFLTAGKLRCAGSPMFLKKKFDTGYKMRVAKASTDTDTRLTLKAISTFLDGAVLESNTNQEFCVNLGFPSTETLVQLFSHLEDSKLQLGIANLGVSVTTMEDVFLKVGAAGEDNAGFESSRVSSTSSSSSLHSDVEVRVPDAFPKFIRLEGPELFFSQFSALFVKRFNTIKREWWMALFLFILPVLLTVYFCVLDEWAYSTENESDIHYSLGGLYGRTEGFISSTADKSDLSPVLRKYMTREKVDFGIVQSKNFTEYLIEKSYEDPLGYRIKMMMGVDIDEKNNTIVWINEGAYHSGLSIMLSVQRMMFEIATGKELHLEVTSHPRDGSRFILDTILKLFWVRIVSVFPISLAVAFLTCSLIMNPIQENISKSKLLQLMSGVHQVIYFGSSFVFDFVLLLSSVGIMMATLLIYNPLTSFTIFADTWQAVFCLLILYGYAMIPLSYILAYIFNKPSTGFMYLLVFNVITGSIVVVVMALFDMLSILNNDVFKFDINAINISLHVLNYVPAFGVVWGFVNIHVNGLAKSFCDTTPDTIIAKYCPTKIESYFIRPCCNRCPGSDSDEDHCFVHTSPFLLDEREAAGFQMLALFIMGTISFLVLILIETNPQYLFYIISNKLRKKKRAGALSATGTHLDMEDVDVKTEREITDNIMAVPNSRDRSDEALIVHGLSKYYGSFLAVDNVTFRVHDGECFGLLGVNGAGKTTTFGMLTGDLLMSRGNAFIHDSDVKTSLRKFQRHIGYCPQFDALIATMTCKELLQLFCALRGVPRHNTNEVVNFLIDIVDLTSHAHKTAGSYSGGNKRKLSIAIAMIGNPRVLFLDEPTAGIDPSARRKIWNALMRAQKDIGSAVVLTSHSMEECEALCHRLCIMVNGRLRCLGSTQHLKSKFGEGFTVLIKLRARQNHVACEVVHTMETMFPKNVILREHHQSLMHFHVTDTSIRWSTLFSKVNEINLRFHFEDVFVSDTTLEQIFLSFAKMQKNADEDEHSESDAIDDNLPVEASSTILNYRY